MICRKFCWKTLCWFHNFSTLENKYWKKFMPTWTKGWPCIYLTWTLVDISLTMYVCLSVHVVCECPLNAYVFLIIFAFIQKWVNHIDMDPNRGTESTKGFWKLTFCIIFSFFKVAKEFLLIIVKSQFFLWVVVLERRKK